MPARPAVNGVMRDDDTLWSAVAFAIRAPSTHNAQPWRWRVGDGTIHLLADHSSPSSMVRFGDRDVLLSCGAALHHLRVALAASGWAVTVRRLPEPTRPDLLATVRLKHRVPEARDEAMATAIPARRSDRRCYGDRAVPWSALSDMMEAARMEGAVLRIVVSTAVRQRLGTAIVATAPLEEVPAGEATPVAGMPAMCGGAEGPVTPSRGGLGQDGSVLMVLGTSSDDRASLLKAGEALSAVLLTATGAGLASCPLSQAFLVPDIREYVRTAVFNWALHPQLLVRVGWPRPHVPALPATPRRPLAEVVARGVPELPQP